MADTREKIREVRLRWSGHVERKMGVMRTRRVNTRSADPKYAEVANIYLFITDGTTPYHLSFSLYSMCSVNKLIYIL